MAQVKFAEQLYFGKVGEGRIARWLISRGWTVLPVYEKEIHEGKGPVVYSANSNLIAPDMLAFKLDEIKWIEAKTKSSFSWHRKTNKWVTGIDLRHYDDYLKVSKLCCWSMWLLFLHIDSCGAKDTPKELIGMSPIGLFGNTLSFLSQHENHRHDNWGKAGMVYWTRDSLQKITSIESL